MSRRRTAAAGRPDEGDRHLSHDVRVWSIRVYEGAQARTYTVRWAVAGVAFQDTFKTRALADGYRAKLLTYTQRGIPLDRVTGLPEPMLRDLQACSWYAHACAYVDMKWSGVAPNSRRSIAETLATVTPALVGTARGMPDPATLRRALYGWAFVKPVRDAGPPAADLASAIRWVDRNTISLAELHDSTRGTALVRGALDALALRQDGKAAAPNTVARKRAVFYNALEYAVELGMLPANPIDRIKWRSFKTAEAVDRRVVINPEQARRLLGAAASQGDIGERLVAFFGCMYYAATRPAEALALTVDDLASLPESGWGELLLGRSNPRAGAAWTDGGTSREVRSFKHRADNEIRPVPAHPDLVKLLRTHVERFGTGRSGRLFVGPYGGLLDESTYLPIWRRARELALTPGEIASPIARRPYDLRHAAVSTWLNAGVPATQVAEWAGHSVAVLLRVYAKCIAGQDEAARRRIEEAMMPADDEPE